MNNFSKFHTDFKYLFFYLFFLFITSTRFVLESMFSDFIDDPNLIFHHHYWFLFVFLIFMINFKLFLKTNPHNTIWTSLMSPFILLPIVYNYIFRGGEKMGLNYLSALDTSNYFKDIATFMLMSDINRPISLELILIVLSIFTFSFYVTKNYLQSFLCSISCYLSLMVFAGTAIVSSELPEHTLFVVKSSLEHHNFLNYFYFGCSLLSAFALFFDDFRKFISEKKTALIFLSLFTIFYLILTFLLKKPFLIDRLMIIPHSFLYALSISVIIFLKEKMGVKLLFFVHVIVTTSSIFANYLK